MIRAIGASALLAMAFAVPLPQAAAQDAVGGAILGAGAGAFIGGLATGRPDGTIAGAIVGGTAGAILGSDAEKRRGYYWWQGDCYRRVARGYVQVSRRYCY
jgi:uncharacterized protein YcfJ